jgi:4-deoxy-L-threo-5-hexosulose-uronate ketol-isomerase
MEIRYAADPVRFSTMITSAVRENFLVDTLFKQEAIVMVYSDIDRAIVGSAVPQGKPLILSCTKALRADYFCQRRELGILNVGDLGTVMVDGTRFNMDNRDALYVGLGCQEISFFSANPYEPARFYLLSYPAHDAYPTKQIKKMDAEPVHLGTHEQSNKRTIYKLIHPGGVQSCQLVMGFTELAEGCVWNTMPPHTHERRMEVYMYFDMPDEVRIFHMMGKPDETRHIILKEGQAVISPSWSIHAGVGTGSYSFCWGMGGENQAFDDMDHLTIQELR